MTPKLRSNSGLVTEVVPHAELEARVNDFARRLGGRPPLAIRLAKRMMYKQREMTLENALEERRAQRDESRIRPRTCAKVSARSAKKQKTEFQGPVKGGKILCRAATGDLVPMPDEEKDIEKLLKKPIVAVVAGHRARRRAACRADLVRVCRRPSRVSYRP